MMQRRLQPRTNGRLPRENSVLRDTAAQIAGRLITALLALITIGLASRYLGPVSFGQVMTAWSFVTVLGLIADSGLSITASREMVRHPNRLGDIAGASMMLRLIIGAVLVPVTMASGFVLFHDDSNVVAILEILAPLIFFLSTQSASSAVFVSLRRNDITAIIDAVTRSVGVGLVIVIVLIDAGPTGYALTIVGASAVASLTSFVVARRLVNLKVHVDFVLWKSHLAMAFPLGLVQVLNALYFRLDIMLLAMISGPREVGLYLVAYKVVELVMALPGMAMTSLMPELAIASNERLHELVQRMLNLFIAVAVPLVMVGAILSSVIIDLIASSEYRRASVVLAVLLLAAGTSFASAVFGHALIASGRQSHLVSLTVTVVVINLVMNIIFIPRWGPTGAAAAFVVSEGVAALIVMRAFHRVTDFRLSIDGLIPSCMAGMVAGLVLLAMRWTVIGSVIDRPQALSAAGVALVAYLVTFASFGGLHLLRDPWIRGA